jgi:hypothetical protein
MDKKLLNVPYDTKIEVLNVSYPSGTAAAIKTNTHTFDSAYTHIVGIAMSEISDGDLGDDYQVGFRDDQGKELIQLIPKIMLETAKGVGQTDKWMPFHHKIKKNSTYTWRTEFESALATDALKFKVSFLLANITEEVQ